RVTVEIQPFNSDLIRSETVQQFIRIPRTVVPERSAIDKGKVFGRYQPGGENRRETTAMAGGFLDGCRCRQGSRGYRVTPPELAGGMFEHTAFEVFNAARFQCNRDNVGLFVGRSATKKEPPLIVPPED